MSWPGRGRMSENCRLRWSWPEVLACFLVGLVMPSMAYRVLQAVGFYAAQYGTERVAGLKPDTPDSSRFMLWAVVIAFPFQLLSVYGLLWHTSRVKPWEIGFPGRNLRKQLLQGLGFAVVLIPVVYGVNWLTLEAIRWLGTEPQEHGFTKLYREGLRPIEWLLLLVAAIVVAPVWEELFFRGLIQPLVTAEGWQTHWGVMGVGIGIAFLHGSGAGVAAVVTTGLWWVLPSRWRGIYAGAVLFAFVHSSAWPSPIPLMLLALGLGRLACNGLTGAIMLHAMFNGVACVMLIRTPLVVTLSMRYVF